MDRSERIYIAPKRGRLPRKPRLGLDRPAYTWRSLMWLCVAGSLITGFIGLVW